MSLLNFELNNASYVNFRLNFVARIEKEIEQAQIEIVRDWGYELYRQQLKFGRDGTWEALDAKYLARKRKEYNAKNNDVNYITTLRRTGKMLDGYIKGIQLDNSRQGQKWVSMNFPEGAEGIRAKSHQGTIGQPKGVPVRPFNIELFKQVAISRIKEAIQRSVNVR